MQKANEKLGVEKKTPLVLFVFKANDKKIEVDNRLGNKIELDDIYPGQISRISILKEKEATREYGEKGSHGVIIIDFHDYALLTDNTKKLFEKEQKRGTKTPPHP